MKEFKEWLFLNSFIIYIFLKKSIHLLRQNKDYTLNNNYVDYQTVLKR